MTALLLRQHEVPGLMDGTATRFARVLKPQPEPGQRVNPYITAKVDWQIYDGDGMPVSSHKLPYAPGDRLVCKEAWRRAWPKSACGEGIVYRADKVRALGMQEYSDHHRWRSAQHMPPKFSRLTLIVKEVDVMRVQDVTEEMAFQMNGHKEEPMFDPSKMADPCQTRLTDRGAFAQAWNATNPKHPWESNPWIVTCRIEREAL